MAANASANASVASGGKMGWFQTPGFISIGDEYEKKEKNPNSRYRGRNMLTNPAKKGRGVDATIGHQFLSLSEGDKYVDPGTYEKKVRLEEAKKKITQRGFVYTSPPKKSSGMGNYYGTFSEKQKYAHEVEYNVLKKGELPQKVQVSQKNILTNPSKRGTFGVPNTTLSKGDEFRYVSDPYDRPKPKPATAQSIVPQPFKSTCRRSNFFDETPKQGVSKVFGIDKALPAKKPESESNKSTLAGQKPWRPSNPAHRGYNATLSRFPEYKEDPLELKERQQREMRKKERPPVVWKPISSSKSSPTRVVRAGPVE
eukprot:PhM_4_TR3721/c0_g2_i1/m.66241